jgi:hypothetical protein
MAPSVSGVFYTWRKTAAFVGTGTTFEKPNTTFSDNGTYSLDATYKGCTFPFMDTTVAWAKTPQ